MAAREPRPRSGADIARALVLITLVTGWNLTSDVIADWLGIETESFASPWKFPLILVGTAITCGGVVGLGSVVWGHSSLRGLGWTFASPRRLIQVGLVQASVCIGMVFLVVGAIGGVAGIEELGKAIRSLSLAQRIFFLVMGVKIAFLEETLFRGDLLLALRSRIGPLAAIVVSSIVFALYHRTLAPLPLFMRFAMGAVFAIGATTTGSLVAPALAHALVWAIVANN
jgi:membrane protease YdiL (CAAX protease family)